MVILVALLAVLSPDFELRQSTARADWYALPGLKVDANECERFLEDAEKRFGVRVPKFQYLRVKTPSDVFQYSADKYYASGVAESEYTGPRIISTEKCSRHEIAHLITFQMGRTEDVFEEGFAAMLAGDHGWFERQRKKHVARTRKDSYSSAQEVLEGVPSNFRSQYDWYVLADGWVRHLVKRHGYAKLAAFFRHGRNAREAFRTVYGQDLDEAFDLWLY